MNKLHPLSTKDVQRMTNDDIIKHVYTEHKRLKLSVEDVWDTLFADFGQQTINNMLKDSDNSWNNDENFQIDSRFTQLGIVYVIAFVIIWAIFNNVVSNKFHALQYAIIVCGLVSVCITAAFMNIAGKNERQYHSAVNKLRKAHAVYTNRGGFKDLAGKPLDYTKEDD